MEKALRPLRAFSRGTKKGERIIEIDFLRGFSILLMVLVHLAWAIGFVPSDFFGIKFTEGPEWMRAMSKFFRTAFIAIVTPQGVTVNQIVHNGLYPTIMTLFSLEVFFAGLFVLLSGISCAFSKSNFKRGFKLFFLANLMSISLEIYSDIVCGPGNTPLYGGGMHIWCGILHALSISIMLYSLFDHFFKKWWQTYIAAIVLSTLASIAIYFAHINNGEIASIEPVVDNAGDFFKNIFYLFTGLKRFGDDYFPPLLTTAVIFLGATIGKTVYQKKKSILPRSFKTGWMKPFEFMGRHSLIIYLTHSFLAVAIVSLVLLCMGYTL